MSWTSDEIGQLFEGEQWKGLRIYESSVWGHFEKAFKKSGFDVKKLYAAINNYGFKYDDFPISMDKKLEILQKIGENRSDSDRSLTVALALVGVVFGFKVSNVAGWLSVIILVGIMLALLAALYMIRASSESKSNKLLEAVYIMQKMAESKEPDNSSTTTADSKKMDQEAHGDAITSSASTSEVFTLPKNDKQ